MGFCETLLRLRNFVGKQLGGKLFEGNRMFGKDDGFIGSDIGKAASQIILFLLTGDRSRGQNPRSKLCDEQRMVRKRREIAFLPRKSRPPQDRSR